MSPFTAFGRITYDPVLRSVTDGLAEKHAERQSLRRQLIQQNRDIILGSVIQYRTASFTLLSPKSLLASVLLNPFWQSNFLTDRTLL